MRKGKIRSITIGMILAASIGLSGCGNAAQPAEPVAVESTEISSEAAVSSTEPTASASASEESAPASEESAAESVEVRFEDNFAVDAQSATDFAKQVKEAVKEKDQEGLAALMSFPVYIGLPDGKGGAIETKDEYMQLSVDDIFSDDMIKSMELAEDTGLSASMAGFTLCGGSREEKLPNIIFGVVDGVLKIVGMNY